jgi:hypothetical protein
VPDFDVSMRLHRPEEERVKAERKPVDWSKFTTAIQICGAILTIPVGVAGVYAAYRSNFSVEVTCQALRSTIISTLEKNVDMETKRALARRDVAEFERTCAAIDPDAKRVFASMMAPKVEPVAVPVVTAPEPVSKPVIKANAAPLDPISEAIERESARVGAAKAPATVATPLTTPTVKHSTAPAPAARPQAVERATIERNTPDRTAVAPKGDKSALGEPPAPLGKLAVPAEAAPVPALPSVATRTEPAPPVHERAALPVSPVMPPPLASAEVPAMAPPFSQPVAVAPRPEPVKKSGSVIPFVRELFGSAPPRPPGEISAQDGPLENGPAN